MTPSGTGVHVDDERYPDAPLRLIEAGVRRTLADQAREDVEISVALLPDEEMCDLNARFLGEERTTDVLAFALTGGVAAPAGDVYVGYEQASRQADDAGVSLAEELVRLAIHGTLHVLGHDHSDGPERADSPMFELQEDLLRQVMTESGDG